MHVWVSLSEWNGRRKETTTLYTNQTWLTLAHTRSNNYVCVCIGYIYLAPLLCSACVCVCVLLQPHDVCFNFSDTCAIRNAADGAVDVAASCCLTVLCSCFLYIFRFCCFSVFCFLFGKGVYLSAVKTWLQTWNANANLVQSLHYADKPAKIFSFGLARRPPSLEISCEMEYSLSSLLKRNVFRNNFIRNAWHVHIMLSKIVK